MPEYSDDPDAPVAEIEGVIVVASGNLVGWLEPETTPEGTILIEGLISASGGGLNRRGQPIAAFSNVYEIDCEQRRHRKLAEVYYSPEGRPGSRGDFGPDVPWRSGIDLLSNSACQGQEPPGAGARFSTMAEFVSAFDAEAERLGVRLRATGPTITRPGE